MTTHSGWTHHAAFRALWDRYSGRTPKHGHYAYLYAGQDSTQRNPNSAVLYQPDAPAAGVRRAPLHLRRESPTARTLLLEDLEPHIRLENDESKNKKTTPFRWYAVEDWNAFARVVGLPPTPP